ncbi:galactosyl transferase GMA12/MNN10 family-domain-containing protein [Dichotomocladium elegans]|nr:galactosyl transferase GMA12/MNN10 family-domain-containing protein [Dichotomocladium elegans]
MFVNEMTLSVSVKKTQSIAKMGNPDHVWNALDPEAAAEVQEQVLPVFVREDGPEDAHRFIRWENNIESVHAEDIVVTHVYQDDEFAELSYWTFLKPSVVCFTQRSASLSEQLPVVEALDDDEDIEEELVSNSNDLALNTTLVTSSGKPAIALMTSSYIYDDNCMEPSATLAAMNKRKYALRHGHSFVARSAEFAQQRGRKTVWGKMDAVEKVLPKYDWIFWMDMDAVIMNQERSLFELLDDLKQRYDGEFEGIDLIAAKPRGDPMLNAGVFFLRYSPWSMQFLRDVQGVVEWYNKGPSYEQGAMWQMMQFEENRPHIFLLENDDHTFNTFPKRYQPGDFIVHFAPDKCPNELTLQGLKAAERIERGERITQLDLLPSVPVDPFGSRGLAEPHTPSIQMQKVQRISSEYRETINLLNDNINELYKRDEKVDDIYKKAENLRKEAEDFRLSARKAHQDLVCKYIKWGVIMVGLVLIAAAAIIGGLIGAHVIEV